MFVVRCPLLVASCWLYADCGLSVCLFDGCCMVFRVCCLLCALLLVRCAVCCVVDCCLMPIVCCLVVAV